MADSLLVRNVPESVKEWIDRGRRENGMSQQDFILSVLKRAWETDAAPLFATQPPLSVEPEANVPRLPFTFIDLFAGIGGFRIALERLGGRCTFTSEWDKFSQTTYIRWFGETPHGDIRKVKSSDIPAHDVLAAGFPCQPFSIAGVSKKNSLGHAHGFKCATQGNLFFNLATIIEAKRPPVVFLENVKNLQSHDKGRTWSVIHGKLEQLNYRVFHKVIDASAWVPQHRERVCIVCFDRKVFGDDPPFRFPEPPDGPSPKLTDVLEPSPDARYTLSDHLWTYLQNYAKKHQALGNGFGFGLAALDGITRTLSARYFKDGSEILIPQDGKNPRRLTPRECARLMGFPGDKPIVVSDTQAYRQFGNAVVPKVVKAVGAEILKTMTWQVRRRGCLVRASRN